MQYHRFFTWHELCHQRRSYRITFRNRQWRQHSCGSKCNLGNVQKNRNVLVQNRSNVSVLTCHNPSCCDNTVASYEQRQYHMFCMWTSGHEHTLLHVPSGGRGCLSCTHIFCISVTWDNGVVGVLSSWIFLQTSCHSLCSGVQQQQQTFLKPQFHQQLVPAPLTAYLTWPLMEDKFSWISWSCFVNQTCAGRCSVVGHHQYPIPFALMCTQSLSDMLHCETPCYGIFDCKVLGTQKFTVNPLEQLWIWIHLCFAFCHGFLWLCHLCTHIIWWQWQCCNLKFNFLDSNGTSWFIGLGISHCDECLFAHEHQM